MTSELFPLPAIAHRTYVRVVALPWPHEGFFHECVCRGCAWASPHERQSYAAAYDDGAKHRIEVAMASSLPAPPRHQDLDEGEGLSDRGLRSR